MLCVTDMYARKFSIIFSSSGNFARILLWELPLSTTVPYSLGEADLTPLPC